MMFLNYLNRVLFLRAGFIISIAVLFLLGPATAQIPPKRQITEADYDKWASLWTKSLSPSGKWVSYEIDYSIRQDTLFVQSTSNLKKFTIPAGTSGRFIADTYFLCMLPGARLQLLNLSSGATTVIPNVMRFELAAQGKFFIVSDKGYKRKCDLKIYNEKAKLIDSIGAVTEFKVNDQTDEMVFVTNNSGHYQIGRVNFKKYEKQPSIQNSLTKFHQLVWQKNGHGFAYLTEIDSVKKNQIANYYNLKKQLNYTLGDFKDGSKIISSRMPIVISEQGEFVILGLSNRPITPDKNAVEIWNGNDKMTFPTLQRSIAVGGKITQIRWHAESGEYHQISSDTLPKALVNKNMSHALIFNIDAYGNQPIYHTKTDYYIKTIQSGREQLFLKNHSSDPRRVMFGPTGNTIIYYYEKNWWVYDLSRQKRLNLTQNIAVSWDNDNLFNDGLAPWYSVFGIAGWVNDKKSILIYDQFDIWLVAIDGSGYTRLTNGREKQLIFRIADSEFNDRDDNYLGYDNVYLNLSKGILLNMRSKDDWSSGFAIYRKSGGVLPILFGKERYEQIKRAYSGFIYTRQDFDVSPQLLFKGEHDTSTHLIYQSNQHQKDVEFGKSDLIRYKNSDGDLLKAAIFYPAGYDPSKKYPMVVEIYEGLSSMVNKYDNPSLLNYVGFNATNFTLNGYIVLRPDIKYKIGDPGVSAAKCVVAAVEAVLDMNIVTPHKIGLIGHSFGGFETNYIISQTDLFATAVSGAGISDVVGHYFNLNKNLGFKPDMWRYENQQFRMIKSLYDDKEAYLRNSPIMNADKINTPLLLWAGKSDDVVPVEQSISMYLALRRLGKNTIFLAYPGDDHNLMLPANKIDLTKRIASWFDYYLKDKKPAEWIKISRQY